MISKQDLYLGKSSQNPWGEKRGTQYIRRKNYITQLKEVFGDRVFDTAVDLACGSSYLSTELSVFSKRFLLCDYSEHVLELAKKKTNFRFSYNLNILPEINIESSFDIIYAIEVLCYFDANELDDFFVNVKKIIHSDSYLVITINKKEFDDIDHDFNIEKVYYRYIPFFNIPDHFYHLEKFFDILVEIVKNRKIYAKEKGMPRVSMMYRYRYLLFPLIIFYPFKYICPFLYKSRWLASVFYGIGKLLNKKHERQLLIMKPK